MASGTERETLDLWLLVIGLLLVLPVRSVHMPSASNSMTVSSGGNSSASQRIVPASASSSHEASGGNAASSFDQLLQSLAQGANDSNDNSNNTISNSPHSESTGRRGDNPIGSAPKQPRIKTGAPAKDFTPATSPSSTNTILPVFLQDVNFTLPVTEQPESNLQNIASVDLADNSATDSKGTSFSLSVPVNPDTSLSIAANLAPSVTFLTNSASLNSANNEDANQSVSITRPSVDLLTSAQSSLPAKSTAQTADASTTDSTAPRLTLLAPKPPIIEAPTSAASLEAFFHQLAAIKTTSTTLVTMTSNVDSSYSAAANPADNSANTSTQWDSNAPAPIASPANEDHKSTPSSSEIAAPSISDLPALPNQIVAAQEANTQKDTDSRSPNSGTSKFQTESVNSAQTSTSEDSEGFARTISSTFATMNSDSADLDTTTKPAGTSLLSGAALREHAAAGPAISESLQAWNGGDNAQTAASQMAHLEKNPGSSEMNIALQAETLGNVELKAHITGDQVGATITVDRHDVHAALLSDLPSLHQGLSEKQMHMENVTVLQSSFNSGHTSGSSADTGAQKQQRNANPQRPSGSNEGDANPSLRESVAYGAAMTDSGVIFDSKGRLSVLA